MMNTIQDVYDAVLHSNEQAPVVLNEDTRAYLDDAGCIILSITILSIFFMKC